MSPSESNSLRRALAQSQPVGDHPDADLLTAFSEGSLIERERETVLGHLASCAACREILSLSAQSVAEQQAELVPALAAASAIAAATASAPSRASTPPAPRRSRLWLPWATAASCAVIVCSLVLLHVKRSENATIATRQQKQIAAATGQALDKSSPQPSLASTQPPPAIEERPLRKKALVGAASQPVTVPASPFAGANADSAMRMQQAMSARAGSSPMHAAAQSPQASSSTNGDILTAKAMPAPQVALSAPPPQQQAVNQLATGSANKPAAVNQTVAVQAATINAQSVAVTPEPDLRPELSNASVAAFSAQLKVGAAAGALAKAQPQWRINAQGHLQRKFGGGPWQPAPLIEPARMHVVSVFAGEVWVGGEDARLYRSRDNGDTWQPVPLPAKNGSADTIAHIRFATPQRITVEASDGTSWTTTDGGATWN